MADRNCDWCEFPAAFTVFAAYDKMPDEVHPFVAHYPAAMIRACKDHLASALEADGEGPGSTCQWVVRGEAKA